MERLEDTAHTGTSAEVLRPSEVHQDLADTSQSGLGAGLLQKYEDWQPIACASRSVTDAETRSAQIEKELLSITYACERFHQFVSGQEITVETDHKPLNDCPLRIQRICSAPSMFLYVYI